MSNRPPADITPAQFFQEWIPAQLAKAAKLPSRELKLRSILDGDGGGSWDLTLGPQGLAVAAGANGSEADVTTRQTVQDWRAFVVGEPGGVQLLPSRVSSADALLLDQRSEQMLASVRGEIRFEVTGYNGRTWTLDVKLGRQAAKGIPDATITVDAETYAAMLARTLPAPQAFFQGKIRITGDANLAMQLGMAMMPRFS